MLWVTGVSPNNVVTSVRICNNGLLIMNLLAKTEVKMLTDRTTNAFARLWDRG